MKRGAIMRTIALDTEDDSQGTVLLINFFDGESHYTFKGKDRLPAWNWLRNQGPCRVWACNMEYDICNLFGDWGDELLTLTYNSSCFIKAQWAGHGIIFNDTYRHWPLSVAKMGEYIGLKKMEADGKENKFDDVEYCRRDTEIVWKFVDEMTKRYSVLGADVKNTLASSAFDLFERKYCEIDLKRPTDEICSKLMESAYGGRVEIFKTGLLEGPIDCYDINSLYPSVMERQEYPLPNSGSMRTSLNLEKESVSRIEIEIPDNNRIPCLPYRSEGKLIFPTGKITGTWAAPEIRKSLEDGAKINKVFWSYEYSKTCRPFKKWVSTMYDLRKNEKDDLMKYTLKIKMNSVFGKFTESGNLEIIKKRKKTVLNRIPEHANIVLGVYTTCYGRLRLLEQLRENEEEICYCDTDSVYLKNAPELKTGTGLGEWKHEGRFKMAHFFLPKTYMAVKEDGQKYQRAKGIPRKAINEFFERFSAEYSSPVRYRESRRRGLRQNVWLKKTRSLNAKYEKRVVLDNGETSPIKIIE